MANKKLFAGMLVLAFAMTFVSCGGGGNSGPNNFDGKTFYFSEGGTARSTMKFAKNTWTWDDHYISSNGVTYKYNIRGNYSCSNGGNTATMKATEFYIDSTWHPWGWNYTATLNSNGGINLKSDGASKSIISIDELTFELEGYQVR